MADALILLSAIEHIKKISKHFLWGEEDNFIFISFNKNDFADPNNEDEIHPHLKPILDEVQMKYIPNIGKVINFIEAEVIKQEELEQIQKEMEDMYWKSVVYCEVCHPDPEKMHVNNFVEFGEPTPIENELTEYENPNQKKLFEPILTGQGKLKESDINSVQFGNCTWCNAEYIKCQYCGSVNYIEGFLKDNKLQCEGCDLTYKFSYRYIGNGMQETEVKIINNEDIY